MPKAIEDITAILVAIVGVATLAVLVSSKAKTADVITSAGNAFAQMLKVAVSPVTNS